MAVMHPALWKLSRLRLTGMKRRVFRGAKTPRGAIFFVVGVIMIGLWLGPTVVMSFALPKDPNDLARLHSLAPMIILGMCILSLATSAGERAIYFSPGEVDFLFAGPFGRRELLIYKILGGLAGVVFSATIFSIMFARMAASWHAAYLGTFLGIVFVQQFTMAFILLGQTMAEHAYTRVRKAFLYGVGALVAVAVGQVLMLRSSGNALEVIQRAHESSFLKYVLLPLEPFARTMTAAAPADLALWGAVSLAVDLALFLFVIRLDAEYREAAVHVSQKMYDRIKRAQRSGMAQTSKAGAKMRRVSQFPYWFGAGPVAWRQAVNLVRNSRSIVVFMLFMGIGVALPFSGKQGDAAQVWALIAGLMVWLTIFLSTMLRYDFRSDIEQMDWLKMMPLRASAIVAGQFVVPVALCSLLQIGLVAAAVAYAGRPGALLLAILFAPPLNTLLIAVDNILFLLFPTRLAAFSPGDIQLFGRQLLFMLLKVISVALACGVAALAGGAAYLALGASVTAFVAVSWIIMMLFSISMIPLAAWVFRRFDVSMDTPA
ncbi:MAG: putative ABC exporter domain-containing protein [Candidatus Hydrogenedentes bacterium]|nr:putative ABC exporter domain-containing protein [Candidatus Hydrogenedentota bacterium]